MNDDSPLSRLIPHLLLLSLLAIGGLNPILPELHRLIVVEYGWMTAERFAALFALGQAAPGPNMLFITLVGWHLAGYVGAFLATAAICGPAVLIAYAAARLSDSWERQRWFRLLRAALLPLTTGLVIASAWLLTEAAARGPLSYVITAVTVAVLLTTRLNPLWLLAAGGAIGVAGLL